MIYLGHEAETFIRESTDSMIAVKYINSKTKTIGGKRGKCRIVNTCIAYVAVISGKLFRKFSRNKNHVHKYEKCLLYVIIKLGTNVSGGDKVFIMELESITWGFDIIH